MARPLVLAACAVGYAHGLLTTSAHAPLVASRAAAPARMAVEFMPTPRLAIPPAVAEAEAAVAAESETKKEPTVTPLSQAEVLQALAKGNRRFIEKKGSKYTSSANMVESLIDDPFNPTPVQALVVSCARGFAPVDVIFDADAGVLTSLRVCGNVVQPGDGIVGSCEFALEEDSPPILLVLGNERNDMVATAVARAMEAAGRDDAPDFPHLLALEGDEDAELNGLLKALEPSAKDALAQAPSAKFDTLCKLATKLNVWRSIEVLLTTSRTICERVQDGRLQVHGAYFEVGSGKVQMLGQHPLTKQLTATLPSADSFRTAVDVAVPAEEALAALYAGNQRFIAGMGGQLDASDKGLLGAVTAKGQKPFAIVLGCADSRCPVELLYDGRPGDIFVLRNAGNTLVDKSGATLGSAEYAVGPLDSKLIVVTGHTKCGAVTAAVQTLLAGAETSSVGGSIGKVLDNIVDAGKTAIDELPDAELADQVTKATKYNVFNAMKRIVDFSDSIREGVIAGTVQIHGSVYDINTGKVEWLGEHPDLEKITGAKLAGYEWRTSSYSSRISSGAKLGRSAIARASLQRLSLGNKRFVKGQLTPGGKIDNSANPFAIVLGMSEVRVPVEKVFDVGPGDLVVQRVSGGIAGRPDSTLFSSLEYAVTRWRPKVLMVLAGSDSKIVKLAIDQVSGGVLPTAPQRGVLDRVMVSAMRAQMQVDSGSSMTAAGRDIKIQQLTTELNAFYTVEQLLKSEVIKQAVLEDGLELHAAVLNQATGAVEVLGEHPALSGLLGVEVSSK